MFTVKATLLQLHRNRGKKTLVMIRVSNTEQKARRLGEVCLGLFSFANTP